MIIIQIIATSASPKHKQDIAMTAKQLDKLLQKIGWRLFIDPAKRNGCIINHKEEMTCFRLRNNNTQLEIRYNEKLFGKKASKDGMAGAFSIDLGDFKGELTAEGCVSIIVKGTTDTFIQFYNH